MNQRITAVVVAPPARDAPRPISTVSPRLGNRYCGRTAKRSDILDTNRARARGGPAVYRVRRSANSVTPRTPRTREFVLRDTFHALASPTPRVNSITAPSLHPRAGVSELK